MKKLYTTKRKNSSRFFFALIFSVVCHVLAMTYLTFKPSFEASGLIAKTTPIKNAFDLTKVKFLSPSELQKIKADNRSRQIVANELNGKKERPVNWFPYNPICEKCGKIKVEHRKWYHLSRSS